MFFHCISNRFGFDDILLVDLATETPISCEIDEDDFLSAFNEAIFSSENGCQGTSSENSSVSVADNSAATSGSANSVVRKKNPAAVESSTATTNEVTCDFFEAMIDPHFPKIQQLIPTTVRKLRNPVTPTIPVCAPNTSITRQLSPSR